jgi:hypothetical protein
LDPDKILSEARARIIWGESCSSARDFLVSNGISCAIADAKLREFSIERTRELRKIGLRDFLTGSMLTGLAGIALYLTLPSAAATSGIVKALAVVLMAGLYGLWKLWRGIIYLIRPQSEHKSIPDITASDPLE